MPQPYKIYNVIINSLIVSIPQNHFWECVVFRGRREGACTTRAEGPIPGSQRADCRKERRRNNAASPGPVQKEYDL